MFFIVGFSVLYFFNDFANKRWRFGLWEVAKRRRRDSLRVSRLAVLFD